MNRKVLLVDDEERVLQGYRRTLRKEFDITIANGGPAGLQEINANGPFAVVVSDYRMPEMDGVQFLTKVRELVPDTIRMMLTGQADQDATIAAINDGDVFRYLTKPCAPDVLGAALQAGVEQFRLVQVERELLETTLRQTIQVLIDVLGLVDPETHRESTMVRDRVAAICDSLGLPNRWEFEVAALMSQLGTIALPDDALHRYRSGERLNSLNQRLLEEHPQSAFNLLIKIPRLERIARMVANQNQPPGSRPLQTDDLDEDEDVVAMGAHLLDTALRYERTIAGGGTPAEALRALQRMPGPPFRGRILEVLQGMSGHEVNWVQRSLSLADLRPGMKLVEAVHAVGGLLLLTGGEMLTDAHVERLRRFAAGTGVVEPMVVLVKEESRQAA